MFETRNSFSFPYLLTNTLNSRPIMKKGPGDIDIKYGIWSYLMTFVGSEETCFTIVKLNLFKSKVRPKELRLR